MRMTVRYRRGGDHDAVKAWQAWLSESSAALERMGLPLTVYQDAEHWYDFIHNGHLHWHEPGAPFDALEVPIGQMKQIRAFLERHYAEEPPPLLRFLRVRLEGID